MKEDSEAQKGPWSGLLWWIVGRPAHVPEHGRVINGVYVITIIYALFSMVSNILTGLTESNIIHLVSLVVLVFMYYLSRVHGRFTLAFGVYTAMSYLALAAIYFYNAGINGPTLFLFYLTFHLLIAVSDKKRHMLWLVLHALAGFLLLSTDHLYPQAVQLEYTTAEGRFYDFVFTYVFSLLFIYFITAYLRKNYEMQKLLAEKRAREVTEHSEKISEQNEKLKQIAWLQSHTVRRHVATILGLTEIINLENTADPANAVALRGIKHVSKELDEAIHDVNDITKNVQD